MNDLDQLQQHYKSAVNAWVEAVRAEEALATPDHSTHETNLWDDAENRVNSAGHAAAKAREAYKNGLREKNLGF